MKAHDLNFASRPYFPAARILFYDFTDIGFAPYGDYWRQLRKICTLELLSAKRVQSFRAIREEEVSNFMASISSQAGSPVNLRDLLRALASNITARAAFGAKCKDREAFSEVVQEAVEIVGGFSLSDAFPSIKFLQLVSGRSFQLEKLHEKSDKILENIIQEYRTDRMATSKSGGKDEVNDLVHVLLNLQDSGDLEIPLTDSNIKAVIQDMFSAGGETTSMTIEWAMYEMLKNPKVLEKAQAEKARKDVKSMGSRYLPSLESSSTDGQLEEIPSIGLKLRYSVQRDSSIIQLTFKGVNFEFIPFGAGRRICPGIAFGMANVELPIAQMLYHFD
ncbi:hypothetical protein CRYUN_Cryun26dG0125400 [Craigia yunnanensis]